MEILIQSPSFLQDVLDGLTAQQKYLHSKYFYDKKGDYIFQKIMDMEEYYLTASEMDIMRHQSDQIASLVSRNGDAFDLIELGCGDLSKSVHLLGELLDMGSDFRYYPVDISGNIIENLEADLPLRFPQLDFCGLKGDYLEMLAYASTISPKRKVVLFMGGNIGNMEGEAARDFCKELKAHLVPEDMLIIGFDLKKNPKMILDAYSDKNGITESFNINLLERINRELGANFLTHNFEHFASYDPISGSCRSYLVSLCEQTVNIGEKQITFEHSECIFMEVSQKYSVSEIQDLAHCSGFNVMHNFYDQNNYFVDSVWINLP